MTTATLTLTEFLLARIAEDESQCGGGDEPESWCDRATGVHYGPARVIAECEAKRAIIALHIAHEGSPSEWDPACSEEAYLARPDDCEECRILAAVYADHPDYWDEWRLA